MTIPTLFFLLLGLQQHFALQVLMFFPTKFANSATKIKNAITLKRLKVETLNLDRSWGTYESFLMQILGQSVA